MLAVLVNVIVATGFMTSIRKPSPWLVSHLDSIPAAGRVLDLACGSGRHTRLLLDAGYEVTAIDRDLSRVADLDGDPHVRLIEADLEADPWPLMGERFAGVVVIDYLWRPLFPEIFASVAEGGVLIYETFAQGQELYGRPRRPEYLLAPGELRDLVPEGWRLLAYEHGLVAGAQPAMRQGVVAVQASG